MHQQHSNHSDQESAQKHAAHSEAAFSKSVELDTVEELLQFDQDQTAVPEAIKDRLAKSVPSTHPGRLGWWHRLFGRNRADDIE